MKICVKCTNFCEKFTSYEAVTEDDWQEEIIPRLNIQNSNILQLSMDQQWLLPCDRNFDCNNGAIRIVIISIEGKTELLTQNKVIDEMAIMKHSLSFPDTSGHFTTQTRSIYYPIIAKRNPCNSFDKVRELMVR